MIALPGNLSVVKQSMIPIDALVSALTPKTKLVYVVDPDDSQALMVPGSLFGSILLPPIDIIYDEINEAAPKDILWQRYMTYLGSEEPMSFIATIIAAMVKGFDVILYILSPGDSFDLIDCLYQFFLMNFGIQPSIQPPTVCGCIWDPNFNDAICYVLYMNSLLCANDFLFNLSAAPITNQLTIYKLSAELQPWIQDMSIVGYTRYFNELKEKFHTENKVLINPFTIQ